MSQYVLVFIVLVVNCVGQNESFKKASWWSSLIVHSVPSEIWYVIVVNLLINIEGIYTC